MKFFIYIAFVCTLSTPIQAATAITVIAPESNRQLKAYTERAIQENLPHLNLLLLADSSHLQVIIVNTDEQFTREVGGNLPDWVSAVTLFPRGVMVIKAPRLTNSTLREYRTTVVHELVHLVQGKVVPLSLVPRWFSEGLATYLSEEYNYRSRVVLSRALLQKRVINLAQLENWQHFSAPVADLAYAESAAAIEFICAIYGPESIGQILRQMRTGRSFEQCLGAVINDDYARFFDLYQEYIQRKYAWAFLLDFQYILWLFLSLMVVIIYWRMRQSNKKKLALWQEEAESEDDQD